MTGIRLLHFSDAHIGTESYGRIDPETGLNTRLADFTAVLDEMVEHALGGDSARSPGGSTA
jgi:exonuclease SbcD